MDKKKTIVLVGNPNTGKSTIFKPLRECTSILEIGTARQ